METTLNFDYFNVNDDKIFERTGELFLDCLPEAVGQYGYELHNYLFNEDCAFIYDCEAEAVNSVNTWSAIRLVKKYEEDNFGESNTEIEPCKIANMLVYIYGEFLLAQVKHLRGDAWDRELTEEDLEIINDQLEQWLEANAPTQNDHYTNQEIDGQVWDYYGAY